MKSATSELSNRDDKNAEFALTRRLAEVEAEIARLIEAIASGAGASQALSKAVATREQERADLQRQRNQLPKPIVVDPGELVMKLNARVRRVAAVMKTNPTEAREVLAALLDEPLIAAERDGGWEITGAGNLEGLLQLPLRNLASPPGSLRSPDDGRRQEQFAQLSSRCRSSTGRESLCAF